MGRSPRSSAPITSSANRHARWFRDLGERRGREAAGAFLVEGPRAVSQALDAGSVPARVAYAAEASEANPRVRALLERLQPGVETIAMDLRVLRSLTDTATSQGIVAAFPLPPAWNGEVRNVEHALLLVLDRVADPGNVGTLLRSAAAAGCDGVLLSPGCADPWSPKVVRASAGGVFGVPFGAYSWPRIADLVEPTPTRYAAEMRAERRYYEADLRGGCVILVGNEAGGLGDDARALATDAVTIPMTGGVESLNAAVAGSLLLFEAARQRSQASPGASHVPGGGAG